MTTRGGKWRIKDDTEISSGVTGAWPGHSLRGESKVRGEGQGLREKE